MNVMESVMALISSATLLVAVHLKVSCCVNGIVLSMVRIGPFMTRFVPVSVH